MRILILHKWLVAGGIETILVNYLNIFNSLNYEVDLLIMQDLENDNFIMSSIPDNINISFLEKGKRNTLVRNLFYKLYREIDRIKTKNRLKAYLEKNFEHRKYDIVIDFSGCLDRLIIQNNFIKTIDKYGILTIRWIHNQLDLRSKRKNKYINIFKKYNCVIAICEQMKEKINEQLNYNNVHVIPNPINIEKLRNLSASLIESKNLPKDKYILQISRLVDGKGHFELLEIYAKLKELGIKQKLYFIGDGENKYELEKKIEELKLIDDCFLLGEIRNPYPYLRNADLFVHTSESEGLPTVILESMALGIPVVAMDCPTGPKYIIGEDNKYGKLIPMHDKDKFIEGVMSLLNNKSIWQYYSKQSLIRIQDFSIEKILLEIDNTLKKIIEKNNLNK